MICTLHENVIWSKKLEHALALIKNCDRKQNRHEPKWNEIRKTFEASALKWNADQLICVKGHVPTTRYELRNASSKITPTSKVSGTENSKREARVM